MRRAKWCGVSRKRRPATVLDLMIKRLGIRRAVIVGEFIVSWCVLSGELGREPTVEEFAVHEVLSRPVAFRRQRAFRECFAPERFKTPNGLARAVGVDLYSLSDVARLEASFA